MGCSSSWGCSRFRPAAGAASTEAAMVLHGLQSLLGRLYDVDLSYDVYDFLVTDRRALSGMTPVNARRAPEEELLLAPSADGGAGVSLYIDPEVLSRLERSNPMGALTEANI